MMDNDEALARMWYLNKIISGAIKEHHILMFLKNRKV
jgi:hypothetical protein